MLPIVVTHAGSGVSSVPEQPVARSVSLLSRRARRPQVLRCLPLMIGLGAALPLPAVAQESTAEETTDKAPWFPDDRNVITNESVAVSDEGHSFFINPAGAAFTEPESVSYYQTFIPAGDRIGPGDMGRGLYWSLPNLRFAWQYVATKDGPGQGVLAFSQSRLLTPSLAFGSRLGFHYFQFMEKELSGLIGLSLGLQARPNRALSIGFAVDNVLSPVPPDIYRDFRARGKLGIGLRPFGDHLTLTADARAYLGTLDSDPGLALQSTLTLEPLAGIKLHSSFEWLDVTNGQQDFVVGLGATLRLGKFAIGDQGYLMPSSAGLEKSTDAVYLVFHSRPAPTVLQPGGLRGQVWELNLAGALEPPPTSGLGGGSLQQVKLAHQLWRLRMSAINPRVKGVLIRLDDNTGSIADMQELRVAIQKVRASGKRVVAYLQRARATDLYLASACDKILLHPMADLELEAPSRESYYLKTALERLGVGVEVVRMEAYKSSPERFMADGPSAATQEMNRWLLEDLLAQLVEGLSQGRGLTPEAVKAAFQQTWIPAREAVGLRLVDELRYPDELEDLFPTLFGGDFARIADDEAQSPAIDRWGPRAHVGLVYLKGDIGRDASGLPNSLLGGASINARATVKAIEELAEDRTIRSVVVRVDSPGGGVYAADEIWRAIKKLREKKPVVVSMSSVAASGGYYLSLPAEIVMADPGTITGSIGVFSLKPEVSALLKKYDINPYQFQSLPGQPSLDNYHRPWSDAERQLMTRSVTESYEDFLAKVADARKMSVADVRALAGGRVWTGRQALEHKLIDRIGGLDVAIELAREWGKISKDAPLELTIWPSRSLQDGLLDSLMGGEEEQGLIPKLLSRAGASFRRGLEAEAAKGNRAEMP